LYIGREYSAENTCKYKERRMEAQDGNLVSSFA
jgi:hypothetical protein